MAVVADLQSKRPHDRLKPRDVFRQLRGTDRRVFDERDGFSRSGSSREKREAGFAHRPNKIHFDLVGADQGPQSKLASGERREPAGHVVIEKFDEQDGLARFLVELEQLSCCLKLQLASGLFEEWVIDMLDRGG